MQLMGLFEVAQAAGVSPQAVSNWRARGALPDPVATLASGPIWETRVIDAWLKQSGRTAAMTLRESHVAFREGTEYTHAAIVGAFGGEPQSYLPQVNGSIVAGRFKTDKMNPRAPWRIIVGNLPRVVRKAEVLAEQEGSIPVFLKLAPNRWKYHGRMQCIAFDKRAQTIDAEDGAALRDERPAGVLLLKDIK